MQLDLEHIGDRVQEVRQKAGMTQAQLAESAGLSLRGLQSIEYHTTKEPSVVSIVKIAEATGADLVFLITGVRPTLQPMKIVKIIKALFEATPDQIAAIQAVLGLSFILTSEQPTKKKNQS